MPVRLSDTRIPLSGAVDSNRQGGVGENFGPIATLGALMRIKESQMLHQQRLREEELKRRELEDDDAIRTTLQQYQKPDQAIDDLYKQGRATAAAKLGNSIFTERKKQVEAYDAQLLSTQKKLDFAAQQLQGVKDDVTYQALRPTLVQTLTPVYGQAINDMLPTQYNKQTVDALVAAGTTRSQHMTGEHNASQLLINAADKGLVANPYAPGGRLAEEGVEAGSRWSKAALEIQDNLLQAASITLPNAQNKTQWDAYLTNLHAQGASDETLRRIPQWDEADPDKSRKAAAELGLTQKDRATISHQKTMEEQGERRVKAAEARAGVAGGGGRGISPTRTSEVRERRNKRNQELEKLFKEDWAARFKDVDTSEMTPEERQAHEADKTLAQTEYVDGKLQIENDARNEEGYAPLEEVAKQAVAEGDRQAYDTIKRKYDAVTTGLRKLESVVPWSSPQDRRAEIDKLRAEFNATNDPVAKAEIQAKIRKLQTPPQ